MTNAELTAWLESRGPSGKTHYRELLAGAYDRTKTSDKPVRKTDTGQAEAERVVQSVVRRALESSKFAVLDPDKAWPWFVQNILSEVSNTRRATRRANAAKTEWSGVFISEASENGHGNDHDDEQGHSFAGPRGLWRGEYTVEYVGPCVSCGGHTWTRLELGSDRERSDYSKRRAVDYLTTLWDGARRHPARSLERLAHWLVGALVTEQTFKRAQRVKQARGCWNGHRKYSDSSSDRHNNRSINFSMVNV